MNGNTCRGCGLDRLSTVLDLGDMPLANNLLSEDELDAPEARYPLALAFCPDCSLVQITESVPPESLFREYAYFSSVSDAMVQHARRLVDRMVSERGLDAESLVIEIASNDGYLLRHYIARGIPVLGIEPARNIAAVANAEGIPTLPEFFGSRLADDLRRNRRLADVVHANNVLAHVPDLHGVLQGMKSILKPGGVAVIETPYVRDLIERLEFDTIYHEHLYYYSLSALGRLLAQHGLMAADVERIPIHGGSMRIFVTPSGSTASPAVVAMLREEREIGLTDVAYFDQFAARVLALSYDLNSALSDLKRSGRSIAAYGAAAKGAVLLNAFGIGRETLDFVADRSPHKRGRFMPGVHVPIVPAEHLADAMPDACLLLAWNFADEVLAQQATYTARGGTFIIPVPSVRMMGPLAT